MGFCMHLRDHGKVVVVPGTAFGEGGRGHIRLSYAGDPDQIREGVRRLAPFWREA
jgi:aspartate/methionine/tyrosine aminotransferase